MRQKPLSCWLFLYGLWMLCCALGPTDPAPIQITLAPTTTGAATLSITTHQKTYTNIRLEWQVIQNGLPGQKGVLSGLSFSSIHPTLIHLPLKMTPGNEETWLRVTVRSPATAHNPAPPATVFLPLRPWQGDTAIPPTGELTFTDSNNVFTITSPNTLIQFDKQTGWLLHYETGHLLLLNDTAGLTPGLWPSISPHLQLFSTSTGAQLVIVKAEYTIPETGSLLHLSYTIDAAGSMLVGQVLETDTTQHIPDSVTISPLPRFGWRYLLPAGPDTLTCFAAPDPGDPPIITKVKLDSPVTGPRETNYTAVRWLNVGNHDGTGWRILSDSSLLHAQVGTAIDSNAHASRTVLDLDAATFSSSSRDQQFFFKFTPAPPPVTTRPTPARKTTHP